MLGETTGDPMPGEGDKQRDSRQPEIIELVSVPGFIVLDMPGTTCAGGTRLAPDVTIAEVALLARAMTYKFAAIGAQVGGAKAGLIGDPADRAELMTRYCAEIRPLADAGLLLTGPDMGTSEEDFALLREHRAVPAAMRAVVGGLQFEDVLTGYGVAVAAQAALRARWGGGWEDRSVAIEGFGKVGGGVAREVTRRGGRVVAVSTIVGCLVDSAGLDVERLLALREAHGDACVARYGLPIAPPDQLFTAAEVDVLVPGTRPGRISRRVAESLPPGVRVVAPAANAPYTSEGADALGRRGILALPDFVCNAGGVIGYRSDHQATPQQVLGGVEDTIGSLIAQVISHPGGPIAGACESAAEFLRGWWGEAPDPPFAPSRLSQATAG